MNEVCQGLILKIKPYREFDALVSVYLKEFGKCNFIYRGFHKPNSKILSKGQLLTLYEYRFNYRDKSLLQPIEISLIQPFSFLLLDPHRYLLAEIGLSIFDELDINEDYSTYFQLLFQYLFYLNQSLYPVELILSLFLSTLLKLLGLSPYVDGALNIKSEKVNHFSIKQGGFVFEPSNNVYSLEELRQIRYIYKGQLEDIEKIKELRLSSKMTDLFVEFFEFHTAVKLKSYELYQQLK